MKKTSKYISKIPICRKQVTSKKAYCLLLVSVCLYSWPSALINAQQNAFRPTGRTIQGMGFIEQEEKLENNLYFAKVVDSNTTLKNYGEYVRKIDSLFQDRKKEIKKAYEGSIKTTSDSKKAKKTKRDSIESAYTNAYQSYSKVYDLHHHSTLFFPARNRFLTRYYYTQNLERNVEALKQQTVLVGLTDEGNSSFYSEIISAYSLIFKISLGLMVSKAEVEGVTSEEVAALSAEELDERIKELEAENSKKLSAQNLLAGGGNALLNFSTPLMTTNSNLEDLTLAISLYESIGFNMPEIGTFSDDIKPTNNFGIQLDFWHDLMAFSGERGQLAVFFDVRGGIYSNGDFVRPLKIGREQGISDKEAPSKRDFKRNSIYYLNLSAGLEISRRFRLVATYPIPLYDELKDAFKPNISLNILPYQ